MSSIQSHDPFVVRPFNAKARITNGVMFALCTISAMFAITMLVCITGYVIFRGIDSFMPGINNLPANVEKHGFWSGISESLPMFSHVPTDQPTGMRNSIAGTALLILVAGFVGVPLGILCGIYLAEFARDNFFTRSVRLLVDVLAGTPSIIVGVLAYQLVVVPMGTPSGWAGVAALAFMMIPIIARTTEEMLKLVPKAYREASVGVGGSQFQTLFRVTLPAAKSGIITGVMLAIARIAGETAPLYFTTFGSNLPVVYMTTESVWVQCILILTVIAIVTFTMSRWSAKVAAYTAAIAGGITVLTTIIMALAGKSFWLPYPSSHFDKPYPTLTVQIFENATSADVAWREAAWGGVLILIVLITTLNLVVRYVSRNKMGAGH